jgi:hypothetical protein
MPDNVAAEKAMKKNKSLLFKESRSSCNDLIIPFGLQQLRLIKNKLEYSAAFIHSLIPSFHSVTHS